MVKFITGASGSGKSTEMMKIIDFHAEAEDDICIIVPEQFSYEFDKNLYKKIGPQKFNKLFSLSFTSLARQLFQLYGDGKRTGEYADDTARMIIIYQALANTRSNPQFKKFFEKQFSHSGFAEEVLKLICEMKKSGITPEELMAKSVIQDKRLMDKTNDIALIYLEYERLMSEYNFKDNWDDISEAAEIANLNRYFCGKNVFIDEFESFTGDQIKFIKVIISSAKNVYITLRTEDVNAGEFTLFETVNNTYREISGICRELKKSSCTIKCNGSYRFKNKDITYLSQNILRDSLSNKKHCDAPVSENIKIFEAKDYYSEAEYVCATIKRLICSGKFMRYSDIAVISNNIEQYSEVLKTAFERYNIPYFMSIEKPVVHTSVMIFVSALMNIVISKKYNSELLFRFMKCGLLDISLIDISEIENYCYKWGIEGNVWAESFTAPDDNLEKLESIRKSIIAPLEKLKKSITRISNAKQFCSLIYEYLVNCGAEKNISLTMSRLIIENKDYEASEIKKLWSCLIDILDSISETLGDTPITASEVKRIVSSLIGRITYSVPPQTLDSVTAASARTARLNGPKVVFIMGANDGSFPNTVNIHGIFSELDKQKLSDCGIELSRPLPELIASERLVVYKSLSAASEKIFITYPLSDLSGQAKYSAPIIDTIINLFNDSSIRISESQISPDYYAVTMKSAYYHYMQDRTLNNTSTSSIKQILNDDSDYKRKLDHVIGSHKEKKNFRISSSLVEQLKSFDPMWISPSSFELYNKCHFSYFCQECLRLIVREKVDIDNRYTGNIIHDCFCRIISSRKKNDFVKMSYEELQHEIRESANEYLEENMGGGFAKNPRFELGFNKLSERLVRILVHTQQELMASSFEPHSFEINLRDEKVNGTLYLPFGNGKSLSFGGIVDRVDVCSIDNEKYVRIIDYKSTKKEINEFTLANGINMQMILYLFMITQDSSIFSGYKQAGLLYSPTSIKSIETENVKKTEDNQKAVDSNLKTSGLILGDKKVLEAMEHDISGNYVPAKLNKYKQIDKKSSCISSNSFSKLQDFTYRKLIEMAESVYSGYADADPLIMDSGQSPCDYCSYINICGNSPMTKFHDKYCADTSEAKEILNSKTEEDDDNGMD